MGKKLWTKFLKPIINFIDLTDDDDGTLDQRPSGSSRRSGTPVPARRSRRVRRAQSPPRNPKPPPRLPEREIADMFEFTATEEFIDRINRNRDTPERRKCCVCQFEFEVGEGCVFAPCAHLAHMDCLAAWLRQQGTCPECRHSVRSPGAQHSR